MKRHAPVLLSLGLRGQVAIEDRFFFGGQHVEQVVLRHRVIVALAIDRAVDLHLVFFVYDDRIDVWH